MGICPAARDRLAEHREIRRGAPRLDEAAAVEVRDGRPVIPPERPLHVLERAARRPVGPVPGVAEMLKPDPLAVAALAPATRDKPRARTGIRGLDDPDGGKPVTRLREPLAGRLALRGKS